MRKSTYIVPLYDIEVTLIQVDNTCDSTSVRKELETFGAEKAVIDNVVECIVKGYVDGGVTFREMLKRKIMVVFYTMDDEYERASVYSHEKRHIEDRILDWAGVEDIESAGLLAGFLGRMFRKFEKGELC